MKPLILSTETEGTAGMTAPASSTTFSAPSSSSLFADLPTLSFSIGSSGSTPFQFGGLSLPSGSSIPSMKTSGPTSDGQPALSAGTTKTTSAPSFALGSILSTPSSNSTVVSTGVGAPSLFGSLLSSGVSSSFPLSLSTAPFKLPQFGAEKSASGEETVDKEEKSSNGSKMSSAPKDGALETAVHSSEVDASKSILGINKPVSSAGTAAITGGRPAASLLTAEDTGEPAGKQGSETEELKTSASIAPSEDDKDTSVAPDLPPVSITKEPATVPVGVSSVVAAATTDTSSVAAATVPLLTSTSPSQSGDSTSVTTAVVLQVTLDIAKNYVCSLELCVQAQNILYLYSSIVSWSVILSTGV